MRTKTRYKDITRSKTITINELTNDVKVASTTKAMATASYNSFLDKQKVYDELIALAKSDYDTKRANWDLLLTLKSSLISLRDTSFTTNIVAQETDEQVKKMIEKWQKVTDQTIRAADAINMTSTYIVQRKASNQLLSNDLLTDATKAAKAADSAVTLVITALTNALATLSASDRAKNSTALTLNDIDQAISMVVDPESIKASRKVKLPIVTDKNNPYKSSHVPLEVSLKKSLDASKAYYDQLVIAVDDVNNEVSKAKEDMDQATADLATHEAALKAAEAAVTG
ncbi:MAG: hypothetical protein WBA74_12610 [Cyclobacteriaceae bacterium]